MTRSENIKGQQLIMSRDQGGARVVQPAPAASMPIWPHNAVTHSVCRV